MNYIFGSGIIGMLAKEILPGWTVIPFNKSRFFSYSCPLDDNFIIKSDKIDGIIQEIVGKTVQHAPYKRSFSYNGMLYGAYNKEIFTDYLIKVFGNDYPPHAPLCMANRMEHDIYYIRVNELYQILLQKHKDEILKEAHNGKVTQIGDHYFIRNGIKYEFDNVVSTIPLDMTYSLAGMNSGLSYRDTHYIRIMSDAIDLEGANQALVVDGFIPFFKIVQISASQYVLYMTENIQMPGVVLSPIIKRFEVVDGCCIPNSIQLGKMPDYTDIEKLGFYPVGGYAQWDWCADIGSNIIRLMQYLNSGFAATRRIL